MPKQRVTVEVVTPQWQYCDLPGKTSGKKSGERCRFCKTTKERGQGERHQCLLFNVELSVHADCVEKTPLCYMSHSNRVIDQTQHAMVQDGIPTKDISKHVRQSIQKVKTNASMIHKQGVPLEQSWDIATQIVMSDWK